MMPQQVRYNLRTRIRETGYDNVALGSVLSAVPIKKHEVYELGGRPCHSLRRRMQP